MRSRDFLEGSKRRSPYQAMDAHVVGAALGAAVLLALGARAASRAHDRSLGVALRAGAVALTGKALLAAFYEG